VLVAPFAAMLVQLAISRSREFLAGEAGARLARDPGARARLEREEGGTVMKCPRCRTLLNEVTKAGVLIDVCDRCLGVWLERGELEKITTRLRQLEQDMNDDVRAPARPRARVA
jgi:Zn-finger nucleic acid-binding protein